jgi:hypothetical protein
MNEKTVLRTLDNVTINGLSINVNFEREKNELPSVINARSYNSDIEINVNYHPRTGKVNYSVRRADVESANDMVSSIITKLKEIVSGLQEEIDNASGDNESSSESSDTKEITTEPENY